MNRVAALLGCLTLGAAGCGRPDAVDEIDAAVRQLPGVAATESDYESSWNGGTRFALTAVLKADAVAQQAGAVGQTFTDLVNRKGFTDSDVTLEVDYPVNAKSAARFAFGEQYRPAPQAVSEALREWLEIARSPGVAAANLVEPQSDSPESRDLGITVDQAAKDSDLRTLVRDHPDLSTATWILVGRIVDREDAPTRADFQEKYEVLGMLPDEQLREQWNQIVNRLGGAGTVTARSDLTRGDRSSPATDVTVNFPNSHHDSAENLAQARLMFPLLKGLPLPARVEFGGDVFTVGGCSAPDPHHRSTKLEAELRQEYERC